MRQLRRSFVGRFVSQSRHKPRSAFRESVSQVFKILIFRTGRTFASQKDTTFANLLVILRSLFMLLVFLLKPLCVRSSVDKVN